METGPARQPVQAARPVVTLELLAAVWLAGAVMMLTYMLASYLRIYYRVRTAVRLEDNVYRCGQWGTPFVLGLFRPRIYVPEDMDEADLPQVLAHERCHIRRGDHAVKPLAFLLLAVHWFNPVLWAAYILLGRDMENAWRRAGAAGAGRPGPGGLLPGAGGLRRAGAPGGGVSAGLRRDGGEGKGEKRFAL